MTDRRGFVAWLGSLPLVGPHPPPRAAPPIVIDATPTAPYPQPGPPDVGLPPQQGEGLEAHRRNLDAGLARLPAHPDFRWTAGGALQLISYVESRAPAAGEVLARAIRDGKIGVSALFAQPLTGILDHETFARVFWPAGLFAREHGLGYQAAQLADVPGQALTFPTLLAASGVRYLASAVNPERAAPLLSPADAARAQLGGGGGGGGGEWTTYPQLYWWEG